MHSLQANELKALNLIPGLVDKIPRHEVSSTPRSRGVPCTVNGVRRPVLLRVLIEEAQARGVPVVFGHQLFGFEQHKVGEAAATFTGLVQVGALSSGMA